MKYRLGGREGKLSFGVYPDVSLKEARARRDDARRSIRDGTDPSVQKKVAAMAQASSFKAVALEWRQTLAKPPQSKSKRATKAALSTSTFEKNLGWLDDHVFPYIGNRPINSISPPELLAVIRRVEKRGTIETTHRVLSTCSRVFRYGVATSACERDVAADLSGALTPVTVTHHAALTDPQAIGGLLRALDGYRGEPVTQIALGLLPLVFLRSSELRFAQWPEIDFDAAEWRVPAARMKMKQMHIVPLARQALALLEELRPLTGAGRLMFPGARSRERPISENTVNAALRRLGYTQDEMTGTASGLSRRRFSTNKAGTATSSNCNWRTQSAMRSAAPTTELSASRTVAR